MTRKTALTRAQFEDRFFGVLRWFVIAFLVVITVIPFYYMVLLSLKPIDALLLDPGSLWISAKDFTFSTYEDVLRSTEDGGQGFLKFLLNSALVSLGTVILTLVAAVPGAYAVSRLKFFGHRQISALFLAVYLFPTTLLAVPCSSSSPRSGCPPAWSAWRSSTSPRPCP